MDSNSIHIEWIIGTLCNWKNQNPGSRFGATSKKILPIQHIHLENGPNGLNWQYCLAGSSKTAPWFWFFLIAMSADYSFKLNSIVHWVPQFFMHNKSILGGVGHLWRWPLLQNLETRSTQNARYIYDSRGVVTICWGPSIKDVTIFPDFFYPSLSLLITILLLFIINFFSILDPPPKFPKMSWRHLWRPPKVYQNQTFLCCREVKDWLTV